MSAPSAPEAEQRDPLTYEADATTKHSTYGPHDVAHPDGLSSPHDDSTTAKSTTHIKSEDVSESADTSTPSTLRPTPQPSAKRRESEAAAFAPDTTDQPNKKRKRASSPPWQFPIADTSTLKTADGRRVSARVNVGTPGLSESEGRGRSVSLSQSSRSRPVSPPWKKFGAEGPTSIQIGGIRKSGRVNKELADTPKRVSPRTKKQANKQPPPQSQHVQVKSGTAKKIATDNLVLDKRLRKTTNATPNIVSPGGKRSSNSSANTKIAELQAQIAALQPSHASPSSSNRPQSSHERSNNNHAYNTERDGSLSPSTSLKHRRTSNPPLSPVASRPSPKIKLRNSGSRRFVPPPHPQAKWPSPAHPPRLSLFQVMERYELQELQQPYFENDRGPPGEEYFVQRAARQAAEEGAVRRRILREAKEGGSMSQQRLSLYQDERQAEPPGQYGHLDHLVAHAMYLRLLQQRERAQHRALAKKLAHEALEYWRLMHGPTEEDLQAEQDKILDLIKKQVVADMKSRWDMADAYVQAQKKAKFEREQEAKRAEKLQKKLEYSEALLARQRGDLDSDIDMEEYSESDSNEGSEDEDDEDEDGDASLSENMSEADSDAEDDQDVEMGESELAAYLAQRHAEPPDKSSGNIDAIGHDFGDDDHDERDEQDVAAQEDAEFSLLSPHDGSGDHAPRFDRNTPPTDLAIKSPDYRKEMSGDVPTLQATTKRGRRSPSVVQTQAEVEVEEHLSSDESTDMDSEDYDSDEDMSSTGDENNDASDDEVEEGSDNEQARAKNSLLGFYTSKDFIQDRDGGLPTPVTSVENGGDNARSTSEPRSDGHIDVAASVRESEIEIDEQHPSGEIQPPQQFNPNSSEDMHPTPGPDDTQFLAGHDPDHEASRATADEHTKKDGVPPPALLRGKLRTYQHAGLDWLASLYRNGTNGILADEMGLGKTIQTISLLAHLAEVHEVWESHLVIVPTSVILNWVTEFNKFLPGFRVLGYYGTMEERAIKRRGWANDPHHEDKLKRGYNVVITSYQIALQDIAALRMVHWHYMVLDEAHNIRNYNSLKWQALIRLRSKARLLLTGTPLQNNLTELWALLTFLTAGDDDRSHGELEEFMSHWKDPVNEIFNQGVQKISEDSQKVVNQLHISLRPFLLRRKKSEVEKDLPKKIERVVVCKLSKRQRQLYQEYMGLADIKAALARGSGIQAGAVLLSLRKVCNHPDLFDPRPIQTSFAMDSNPAEDYSVKEQLVRRLLCTKYDMPTRFLPAHNEGFRKSAMHKSRKIATSTVFHRMLTELEASTTAAPDATTLTGARALQKFRRREKKLLDLRASIQLTESGLREPPIYGLDLRELVSLRREKPVVFAIRGQPSSRRLQAIPAVGRRSLQLEHRGDFGLIESTQLQSDVSTVQSYAERMQDIIVRFTFVPPAATAPTLKFAIPPHLQASLRSVKQYPQERDFAHEARVRSSIAFPDARLLIYDAGKLQRLTHLLRDLQARGSRSLIFTQMVGSLDILEQFLSLLNLPYLRLDGATSVERRQLYCSEFNRPDSRYQCMILSSRAGGVGLNLTGASSVIFYDLDWNPQMDRQCMDRAHRIGQVRDVEVYKMVSEKTVEENILRRANQKSLLDQAVIQEGQFTTDFRQVQRPDEPGDVVHDTVEMAVERLFGGGEKDATKALESVEDRDDVLAAQQARKEAQQDDVDFAEHFSSNASKANTPGPAGMDVDAVADERAGHVDYYMIRQMELLSQGVQYVPPPIRRPDKHGRDPSHRPKRKR